MLVISEGIIKFKCVPCTIKYISLMIIDLVMLSGSEGAHFKTNAYLWLVAQGSKCSNPH